jgi:hypothetical protein
MMNQLPPSWYRSELEATFQFVVKCGFVTKPLLIDLFGIQSRWSLARLSHAISQCRFFDPLNTTPDFYAWRLSRSGKYEARSLGLRPSYQPRITSRCHDEMALSIAVRLERLGIVTSWVPESVFIAQPNNRLMVMQDNRGQKYPDLLLIMPRSLEPVRVAIELELSQKSLGRYVKALTGYKAVRGIDAIVFVVRSPAIRSAIETAIRKTRFDQNRTPILFVEKNQLILNPIEAPLTGSIGTWNFRSLAAAIKTRDQYAA